jgi:hypothetical protein
MQLAQQQMTLGQLAQMKQMRQYEIEKRKRDDEAAAAYEAGLPALLRGGSLADVVSANPQAGAALMAADASQRKSRSEEAKSAAAANKDTVEAKLKIADKLGNEAMWLAEHPKLSPEMIANFQKKIASNGLQDILTTIPFQDWNSPDKARQGLAQTGNMFYEIKDRVAQAETGRHNKTTEGLTASGQAETGRHNKATEWLTQRGQDNVDRRQGEANGKQQFANANTLRDEFNRQSGDYIKVRDAHNRVLASAQDPSAAGDLALIFNYMKVLDPGSTVREGEFATAQNSGGVDSRIVAQYNSILRGERLAPEVRNDFVKRSTMLYDRQAASHEQLREQYTAIAQRGGVDPANAVVDYRPKKNEAAEKKAAPIQVGQQLDKMPDPSTVPEGAVVNNNGTRYRATGGKWVTVK